MTRKIQLGWGKTSPEVYVFAPYIPLQMTSPPMPIQEAELLPPDNRKKINTDIVKIGKYNDKYYICTVSWSLRYLHKDGTWLKSLLPPGKDGYCDTYEEAVKRVKKHEPFSFIKD